MTANDLQILLRRHRLTMAGYRADAEQGRPVNPAHVAELRAEIAKVDRLHQQALAAERDAQFAKAA